MVGRYWLGLIPLLLLFGWHVSAVRQAHAILRTSVPQFSRILTTDSIDVRCGTFAREADAKAQAPERFFLHLGQGYTEQDLSSLRDAGRLNWIPNCGASRGGPAFARVMDWVVLPVLQ